MEELAARLAYGPSRCRGALAARAVSAVLVESLKEDGTSRTTSYYDRDSKTDSNLGGSKPVVACAPHSRPLAKARNRSLRANGLLYPADGDPPSQSWKTFLQNHLGEIVAIDFFKVPTIRLQVLFVFLVIEHKRRKVLHFGVTEHPTTGWTAQQLVETFSDRDDKYYLIRDRDSIYGLEFRGRVQSLGIKEVLSAPRSLRQNANAERLIGSIGRECLEHVVVLSRRHFCRVLKSCFAYESSFANALGAGQDAPEPRAILRRGEIVAIPQVGGLHYRYEHHAA